jgi:hypothetical protein
VPRCSSCEAATGRRWGRLIDEGRDPEPWLSEAEVFYRRVGAVHYLRQLDELRVMRRIA